MRALLTILALLLFNTALLCLLFGGDAVMAILGLTAAALAFRLLLVDALNRGELTEVGMRPPNPPSGKTFSDHEDGSAR